MLTDAWFYFALGLVVGVAITFQFCTAHVAAANRVLRHVVKHGDLEGFDFSRYGH